ncbi:hypothetical protein P3S67_004610 [Capsicum chacoense]
MKSVATSGYSGATGSGSHVDKILCLMSKRQLTYSEAYDAADRIMDLDFYKKLKDKYDQLNDIALDCGTRFDFLVSTLDWDEEEMIKYIRGESVNDIHYQAVKILLKERNIKVYDSNEPLINDVDLFLLVQPLMELLPIFLKKSKLINHFPKEVLMKKSWDFEGQNKCMTLPKNDTGYASGSHVFAYIECLLTSTEMAEPTTFLCDNVMANLQEVWAYEVLNGHLEPVYIEEPVK